MRPSKAAVAAALGKPVAQVGLLSPQDLWYCGAARRSCDVGAPLKESLEQLEKRQLLLDGCLPYQQPDLAGGATRQQLCAKSCPNTSPLASKGSFSYEPISQLWQAQRHIRQFGAVVSRHGGGHQLLGCQPGVLRFPGGVCCSYASACAAARSMSTCMCVYALRQF
jgi:hypothetical protein